MVVRIAREGTLNVLRACAVPGSGVKKVVLTSSVTAINEGHEDEERVFSESDWTVIENEKVLAYPRSKVEAERAAWDFMAQLQGSEASNQFTLTCLNPSLLVGSVLIDTPGASITIIKRFMNIIEMPAVPTMQLALVDVEDVAKAHIKAMTTKETDGERIILAAQPSFWFLDIARVLSDEFRKQGYWVTRLQVPNWCVRLVSLFDNEVKQALGRLGRKIRLDNSKATNLLNMQFTDPKQSLIEMVHSMIERGILPKKSGWEPRK